MVHHPYQSHLFPKRHLACLVTKLTFWFHVLFFPFPHFVFAALFKREPFCQICFGVRFPRSSLKKVFPCRSALGVPVFFPVFWLGGPKARICAQITRWTLKGKHLWPQRPHGMGISDENQTGIPAKNTIAMPCSTTSGF